RLQDPARAGAADRRHARERHLGRPDEGAAARGGARPARPGGGRGCEAADRRRGAEERLRGPDAALRPRPAVARANRPADGLRGLGDAGPAAAGAPGARGGARRLRPPCPRRAGAARPRGQRALRLPGRLPRTLLREAALPVRPERAGGAVHVHGDGARRRRARRGAGAALRARGGQRVTGRSALLESLIDRFPSVPPEAVLKEDLLRTGIAFDDAALSENLDGAVKPKSYFIFSFDQQPLASLGEAARRRPPEEIALTGGPYGLRRTIVSVRVNPGSPYRVVGGEGALRLTLEGRVLADVAVPPLPEYYRHTLANGKTVMETAPTIEWGYLVYLTVLRLCQYFGAKEECGFCDINHNRRQHRKAGRPYTGIKPVEDVLEALGIIDRYDADRASKAYTLTGGSVTSTVEGLAEADFYGRYIQAIEERFPGRWIGKLNAQALPRAAVERYRDYGISIYHPNYEVWDARLFAIICPGKQRYVGREEW